jgi:hypothetical protein
VAEDQPVPVAGVPPLDYAAPEAPNRRRAWRLLWLITASHLAVSVLAVVGAEAASALHWVARRLFLPLILASGHALFYDEVPRPADLLVFLPPNSIVYGIALTALGALMARAPRLLNVAALVALAYPLVFVALLYGEWLLAWFVLGHPPHASLDDPGDIAMSADVHLATGLALLGIPWAACAALALNLTHVVFARPPVPRVRRRFALLAFLWVGLVVVLIWDPGDVLYWWFD